MCIQTNVILYTLVLLTITLFTGYKSKMSSFSLLVGAVLFMWVNNMAFSES